MLDEEEEEKGRRLSKLDLIDLSGFDMALSELNSVESPKTVVRTRSFFVKRSVVSHVIIASNSDLFSFDGADLNLLPLGLKLFSEVLESAVVEVHAFL